jgi:hypothetical protein
MLSPAKRYVAGQYTRSESATPLLDDRFHVNCGRQSKREGTEEIDLTRLPGLSARISVQQPSTATTALSNTFGFIQMRPGERDQGSKQLLRGVRDQEVELRGAHVHPGLRAVAAQCFARASASAGQSSGVLSSRDSVEGLQVLSVGVRQRVKVPLGRLDLVVTHPVHY